MVSASSQLIPSVAKSHVDKLFKQGSIIEKGLWSLNQLIIFWRSMLSLRFLLIPSYTCCWLLTWRRLVNELIELWISAQRWIFFSQINLMDSVTPVPLVRQPLLFKYLISTCSMAKSLEVPAQKRSPCLIVWNDVLKMFHKPRDVLFRAATCFEGVALLI